MPHVCDDVLVMDTLAGSADTQLTAAIMSAGAHGPENAAGKFTFVTSAVSLSITDGFGSILPCPYWVRSTGATYQPSQFRSIGHNEGTATKAVYWDISGPAKAAMTVFGLIKLGPPDQGTSSALYDLIRFSGINNGFCVLQLDSGQGLPSGGYAITIETNPGNTTTHSTYIPVVQNGIYWYCMKCDFSTLSLANPTAWLNLYDFPSGVLRAAVTSNVLASPQTVDTVGDIRVGNDEAGVAAGTTTYFKGLAIDYTAAKFPVLPDEDLDAFVGEPITGSGLLMSGRQARGRSIRSRVHPAVYAQVDPRIRAAAARLH